MISRQQLESEGFLAEDGSLKVSVDITVNNPRESCGLYRDSLSASGAHFLSQLEDPGATSDLTVIVGGGNGSAAGGSADSSAAGNSSSGSGGGSGGQPRSFRVVPCLLLAAPSSAPSSTPAWPTAPRRSCPCPTPTRTPLPHCCGYGGEVCELAVHLAAITLCDMLLLPKVKEALVEVLMANMESSTIVADLLWAAQAGQEEVLGQLVAVYRRVAKDVDPGEVAALAADNPQLASRVIVGLSNPPAAAAAAAVAAAAEPADKGGHKRSRTKGRGSRTSRVIVGLSQPPAAGKPAEGVGAAVDRGGRKSGRA